MVTVWNRQANTFTTIPQAELAPGMVQATIEGRAGVVWVDASTCDLMNCEYKHPPFEGNLREDIKAIQSSFPRVYEHSYEFWEDGFRKDTHPTNEILIWLTIAELFGHFTEGRPLDYQKEVFRLLLTCSASPRDMLSEVFKREKLRTEDVDGISSSYFSAFEK